MTPLHDFLQLDPSRDFAVVFLLETTLRVTALLLVATGVIGLCRRASAATRHRLWMLAVCGALVLPVVSLCMPGVDVEIPRTAELTPFESPSLASEVDDSQPVTAPKPAEVKSEIVTPTAAEAMAVAATSPVAKPRRTIKRTAKRPTRNAVVSSAITVPRHDRARTWRWTDVIVYGWAAGAACVFLLSAISLLSAKQLVRRAPLVTDSQWLSLVGQLAEQLGLSRAVELRRCDLRISPMVWGLTCPTILLPVDCDDWSADCRAAVLLHEMAHIQRRDWPAQMLTQLSVVVYWFHPLIWLASKQVRKESDRAADDVALTAGMSATTYAEQLLHIARNISSEWLHPAPAMARRGQFSQRIALLLDPHRRRRPLGRRSSLAAR